LCAPGVGSGPLAFAAGAGLVVWLAEIVHRAALTIEWKGESG
jgi:hypothetical protein